MNLKRLGLATLASLAPLSFVATASATTLEIKGVKQNQAVVLKASHESVSSTGWRETFGPLLNTCTASSIEGTTSTFTGTIVTVPIKSLTFQGCTEGAVVIQSAGTLTIEHIPGSTNGTLRWIGMKVTVPSSLGFHITCISASAPGTHAGMLTGVASGKAILDITPVFDCGSLTAFWLGTYVVTSPEGLGVTS